VYKLIDKNNQEYLSILPGMFGGHKLLKIYGTLDCKSALSFIARGYYIKNRVFFLIEQDAIDAGYRPCAKCLQTKYKIWKQSVQT
jgi:hypothetical protein